MAKAENKPAVNSQPDEASDLPRLDGYHSVTPVGGGQLPWFRFSKGAWIQGRLLGRFMMNVKQNNKTRYYYQVRVETFGGKAFAMEGRGDDAKKLPLEQGMEVNIGETKALEELGPRAESDGIFDVFIHSIEKRGISGGQTFWEVDCRTKTVKPPSSPLKNSRGEDIPF